VPLPEEEQKKIAEYVSFDYLLNESDVISLHCPLLPSTQGIINKANIAKMKDGVILINTSRGPLIVEKDLAEALQIKKVYAAACDVVSTEPILPDNPLLGCYNSILTPHIAWAPKESRQRLMDIAVADLEAYVGGSPINIVNP
jgi:glycerate dehydrogenase